MDILISILAFLVALGLLVTFHEYGHFIVARKLGIKVLKFSVGFGKPIFSKTAKDGVEYVLAAIPLGGFVKMLDEREGPVPDELLDQAFNRKPLWARSLVVLAGPVFNFIFSIVAFWLMFMIGTLGFAPIVGKILPNTPAAQSQIQPMMEIVQVSQVETRSWQQVVNAILPSMGEERLSITLQYPDSESTQTFELDISEWKLDSKEPDILGSLGFEPYQPMIPAVIGEVVDGEAADKAGLKAGDKILSVNGSPIAYWQQFVLAVHPHPNKTVSLVIMRDNEKLDVDVALSQSEYRGKDVGYMGVMIKPVDMPKDLIRKEVYGPWESFTKSLERTWSYVELTFTLLGKMITGKIGLENISGPVTIAQGAGATISIGFQYYLGFLGLISISLGVINLLPIPMLDGGHLFFYAIEAIFRREPSERFMQACYQIGFVMLIGLMGLAFYNDIARLL